MGITDRLTERKWKSNNPADLLPCPCCKSKYIILKTTNGPCVEIYCKNCGITTGCKDSITIAVGVWNRRA
jgi:hypothetical protein